MVGEEETSVRVERTLRSWILGWWLSLMILSVRRSSEKTPTPTMQYLNFNSNHPLEHKKGVRKTLMNRADKLVSDETDLWWEKEGTACEWLSGLDAGSQLDVRPMGPRTGRGGRWNRGY